MFCQGVFWLLVVLFVESGSMIRLRHHCVRHRRHRIAPVALRSKSSFPGDDVDVVEERDRIMSTPLVNLFQTDCLVVRNMSRTFAGFHAVSRLSFGIQKVGYTYISFCRSFHACKLYFSLTGNLVEHEGLKSLLPPVLVCEVKFDIVLYSLLGIATRYYYLLLVYCWVNWLILPHARTLKKTRYSHHSVDIAIGIQTPVSLNVSACFRHAGWVLRSTWYQWRWQDDHVQSDDWSDWCNSWRCLLGIQ